MRLIGFSIWIQMMMNPQHSDSTKISNQIVMGMRKIDRRFDLAGLKASQTYAILSNNGTAGRHQSRARTKLGERR
jgi:hypothetical protein